MILLTKRATIRTEIDSMPTELDEVTRRIMQLEIEEAALGKETDRGSQERLKHCNVNYRI